MPLPKQTTETVINVTLWILGTVLLVAILGLALHAWADERPGAKRYHSYVSDTGSLSFSDDEKRIPERHKAEAESHTWAELAEKVAPRETLMKFEDVVIPEPPANPVAEVISSWRPECSGHVTVEQVRVQDGAYNRNMFVVRDECGNIVSVTPQRPHIHINR